MNVALFGGTGFVGQEIINKIPKEKYNVFSFGKKTKKLSETFELHFVQFRQHRVIIRDSGSAKLYDWTNL